MSLSSALLEETLRSAIVSVGTNTDSHVIFFRPNAPRPALPYTSIQYLSVSEEIDDWDEFNDTTDQNQIFGYRDVTFTVNCYGDNARDEVSTLQGGLRKQTVRDTIRESVSAAFQEMGAIRDIATLVDSSFEERYAFDITMNVNMEDGSTTDDTGYFDTVEPVDWLNKP